VDGSTGIRPSGFSASANSTKPAAPTGATVAVRVRESPAFADEDEETSTTAASCFAAGALPAAEDAVVSRACA
jgi:hypothetical protein